jgi:hypothetical protein
MRIIKTLGGGVPFDGNGGLVGDYGLKVAIGVLNLSSPFDIIATICAIALHVDVSERHDAVWRVCVTWECLLVNEIWQVILFPALARDILCGHRVGLQYRLCELIRVRASIVDKRALEGLAGRNCESLGVGIVSRAPLIILRVHGP